MDQNAKDMSVSELLGTVYEGEDLSSILAGIEQLKQKYRQELVSNSYALSQRDIILITYGDQVQKQWEPPLKTLKAFIDDYMSGYVNSVHILPFYPYTSDDGFSVVDYYKVDDNLGNWTHIKAIAEQYRIMFDAVINHVSQESEWFKGFLSGRQEYANYFIEGSEEEGWRNVTRPRTSPLFHEFEDASGKLRNIWTTFSRDQVDLNYSNPKVFLHILDLLLFYISQGASLLRLDAIGFMWKERYTTSIHLNQTHNIIKAMRSVIQDLSPSTALITETNVPHEENISYFGNGYDEAHMVYNFTLPPLMAYSLLSGDTAKLTAWAQSLALPSNKVCFFNFGASHDGVGVRPLDGIINTEEMNVLIEAVEANNGYVSYKSNPDGSDAPYELNCNYYSLLKGTASDQELGIKRMVLSQAVILAMPGVPGLYFHSIVGSENDNEGVEQTGRYRSINREKLNDEALRSALDNEGHVRHRLYNAIRQLAEIRIEHDEFNPLAFFTFPDFGNSIFGIERYSLDKRSKILALFNFSNENQVVQLPTGFKGKDLLSGFEVSGQPLPLQPYQVCWLKVVN